MYMWQRWLLFFWYSNIFQMTSISLSLVSLCPSVTANIMYCNIMVNNMGNSILWKCFEAYSLSAIFHLQFIYILQSVCFCECRYRLAGLPGDYQEKNISSPETNYCLLKDLIIWTQYQIQVAAYTGAGLGVYSSPVTEYTLQGGEYKLKTGFSFLGLEWHKRSGKV